MAGLDLILDGLERMARPANGARGRKSRVNQLSRPSVPTSASSGGLADAHVPAPERLQSALDLVELKQAVAAAGFSPSFRTHRCHARIRGVVAGRCIGR